VTIAGIRIPAGAALLVWALLWEIAGRVGSSLVLPPLTEVIAAGIVLLPSEKFAEAASITLHAFFVGMAWAVAVGVPVGILMARSRAAGRILGVWVSIFVSAPISALVPILMAVLGIGQETVIFTVFLFAVFIIILDTQVGVQHVSRSLEEMARSFGASRAQLYGKVLLLAALPEMLAGIRLAVIRGVKGVVIGQLLVSIIGVGELFELYSRNFLMAEFWALVLMVFAFAFAMSEAVAWLERRVEYYAAAR
jgi:NitT/TauT family transport system permease protein